MAPEISGTTWCIPLIGNPVVQVKSPPPINCHFAMHGIDAVMFPVDLAPAQVGDFFRMARGWANCRGISVTYPHKQAALANVDSATERARRIGAVNTIRRDADGSLHGEMTDGLAFVAALRATGAALDGCRVLLVGAGGAGGAIAHALAEAGAAAIAVIDIDRERQDGLLDALRRIHPGLVLSSRLDPGRPIDVAVNASTLGMDAHDPLPIALDRLPPHAIIADVVTRPEMTPFLAAARDRGHRIQTGLQMVLAQVPIQLGFLGVPVNPELAVSMAGDIVADG